VLPPNAFLNIDTPLRLGIERWTKALELNPEISAPIMSSPNLRTTRRIALAADHCLKAWRLLPAVSRCCSI
jgi:hypothetical protein